MKTIASKCVGAPHHGALFVNEKIIEVDNPEIFKWNNVYLEITKHLKNKNIIKLNLVKSTKQKLYFNVVSVEGLNIPLVEPFVSTIDHSQSKVLSSQSTIDNRQSKISCLIIPTGIGAAFGGYAGDANPIAKVLSRTNKHFLTHPNVVNGAVLSDLPANLIYLEGYLLDQFLLGQINILPNKQNKIGVIFDKGIPEERLDYEVNVLNALKTFYGCEIVSYTITDKKLSIEPYINSFGFSSGNIQNLEYVIEKAKMLKEKGATAIAICTFIPDLDLNKDYINGGGIDPIGGVESIISRVVSASCGLVSAHAPVLVSGDKIDYKKISPLSASEYIAQTFLPSVISGLRYAPMIDNQSFSIENLLSSSLLSQVLVPYNAFGSPGIFSLNETYQNVILIRENKTSLKVDPDHLNVKFKVCDSYSELLDLNKVKGSGIDLNIFNRPAEKITEL